METKQELSPLAVQTSKIITPFFDVGLLEAIQVIARQHPNSRGRHIGFIPSPDEPNYGWETVLGKRKFDDNGVMSRLLTLNNTNPAIPIESFQILGRDVDRLTFGIDTEGYMNAFVRNIGYISMPQNVLVLGADRRKVSPIESSPERSIDFFWVHNKQDVKPKKTIDRVRSTGDHLLQLAGRERQKRIPPPQLKPKKRRNTYIRSSRRPV